jgi:serine protease Do
VKPHIFYSRSLKSFLLILGLALLTPSVPALCADAGSTAAEKAILEKASPENLGDLKAIQNRVREVVDKARSYTVGIRIGPVGGSGVIISEDGYVLTAGHVVGDPDRSATVILPDGRQVKAKTLGANRTIDSGLIKISEEGKWPHAEMANSADLQNGQWCVAIGHPGGFRKGRTPVVRLGRVLFHNDSVIRTDCTIQGGDSGGPLFDLDGKVIGIHSRIGNSVAANIHVPVDTYRDTWERLAASEVWGSGIGDTQTGAPFLGVEFDLEARECIIAKVLPGTAADKGGLKAGDMVVRFDGRAVEGSEDLARLVSRKHPGDRVAVEVRRDDEVVRLRVTIGKKPD